ncbi:cellulose synthase subunit BcsC [Posidoniimonas corsicana]|uniref:Cellulose synthase subunit BcsC n=1 Tax=Posidoniimonas corsicana TaxID=1938618 RepID=A0A5C5US88_9BACT|nr:tetratricopeptide repeat protein [Posidoniimonas corsicana]TWT29331.1 cellulose synthase subunit BcsC [Posidoniimonas corsicana]
MHYFAATRRRRDEGFRLFGFAHPLAFSHTWLAALMAVSLAGIPTSCGSSPIARDQAAIGGAAGDAQSVFRRKALRAVRQEDVDSALELLRQEFRSLPGGPLPEVTLAGMLQQEGQPQQARMLLEQAVVALPEDPEPHLALADLAWRDRRLSDACLQYERAGQLAGEMPDDSPRKARLTEWALAGLGSVAETRGQSKLAFELFSQLLEQNPKHSQAHYRLGHILFALQRSEEAIAHLTAAAESNPNAPTAELAIAGLHQQAGDTDAAEEWLRRAADSATSNAQVQLALAKFLLSVRNAPRAAAAPIARVIEVDPESQEARTLEALTAWSTGDLERAEGLLEKLTLDNPSSVEANAYLSSVLAERGGPKRVMRAEEVATLNSSSHPNSVPAAAAFGWVVLHAGKVDLAARQLEAAVKANGADRDARYYYARALYRTGKTRAATEQLTTALNATGLFIHLNDAAEWGQTLGLVPNEG